MSRSSCKRCQAPLPIGQRGRGRPPIYCSEACKKAAYRRRQQPATEETQEATPRARCRHCGKRLDGEGPYCSDRCRYQARKWRLSTADRHLTAWDDALITWGDRPQPAWCARVYGGVRPNDDKE